MENYKLVLPGELNQYGFLFGGYLLKWVDEVAWIAATLDYPGCNFVTRGMDNVEFRKSVRQGTILRFETRLENKGTTSLRYSVNAYRGGGEKELIFSTTVTFVNINAAGEKTPLPQ